MTSFRPSPSDLITLLSRAVVMHALDEERRKEFHQGGEDSQVLGDDHFLQKAKAQSKESALVKIPLERIRASVCQVYHLEEEELFGLSRKRLIAEVRGSGWLAGGGNWTMCFG